MDLAREDVMTLNYRARRLIVVESDEAVEVVRRASSENARKIGPRDFAALALLVAPPVNAIAAAAVAAAARQLWTARKLAEQADLPYLVVTTSQAASLNFPIGHPLGNHVYVGDPAVAGSYYPIASFHRVLFEGKLAEALRLLGSLGATEISIEYLEGFDRGAGVDLSVDQPHGPLDKLGIRGKHTKKTGSRAKTTMQLSPTIPAHIPSDLVWLQSEPLWQAVIKARLESGLQSFTIDLSYTDDFGINGGLKAKINKVGLEFGGSFTDFRETVWRLSGSFA